jgi:hypothetical protein
VHVTAARNGAGNPGDVHPSNSLGAASRREKPRKSEPPSYVCRSSVSVASPNASVATSPATDQVNWVTVGDDAYAHAGYVDRIPVWSAASVYSAQRELSNQAPPWATITWFQSVTAKVETPDAPSTARSANANPAPQSAAGTHGVVADVTIEATWFADSPGRTDQAKAARPAACGAAALVP